MHQQKIIRLNYIAPSHKPATTAIPNKSLRTSTAPLIVHNSNNRLSCKPNLAPSKQLKSYQKVGERQALPEHNENIDTVFNKISVLKTKQCDRVRLSITTNRTECDYLENQKSSNLEGNRPFNDKNQVQEQKESPSSTDFYDNSPDYNLNILTRPSLDLTARFSSSMGEDSALHPHYSHEFYKRETEKNASQFSERILNNTPNEEVDDNQKSPSLQFSPRIQNDYAEAEEAIIVKQSKNQNQNDLIIYNRNPQLSLSEQAKCQGEQHQKISLPAIFEVAEYPEREHPEELHSSPSSRNLNRTTQQTNPVTPNNQNPSNPNALDSLTSSYSLQELGNEEQRKLLWNFLQGATQVGTSGLEHLQLFPSMFQLTTHLIDTTDLILSIGDDSQAISSNRTLAHYLSIWLTTMGYDQPETKARILSTVRYSFSDHTHTEEIAEKMYDSLFHQFLPAELQIKAIINVCKRGWEYFAFLVCKIIRILSRKRNKTKSSRKETDSEQLFRRLQATINE